MLFRLVMLVDKKRLGDVLEACEGLVTDMEPPRRVSGAKATTGRVKESGMTAQEAVVSLVKLAAANGKQVITTAEITSGAQQKGISSAAVMYGIKMSKDKGIITQGARGQYRIHADKFSSATAEMG